VKALHALIALRLATADAKTVQSELLAEAEGWSRAAIEGAQPAGLTLPPGQDARVQLVRAKAVLAAAWRRMAQGGLDAGAVGQLRSELTRQHDALSKAVGKAQSPLASFALGMALEGYAVSLGVDRNFAKNVPGQLLRLKAEKPNPWNICGMHATVRQWTITLADRGEAQALWDRLASDSLSPEDRQRAALLQQLVAKDAETAK